MWRAYSDMREANWKNSDKYFHARGNYDAAQRGPGGRWAASVIRWGTNYKRNFNTFKLCFENHLCWFLLVLIFIVYFPISVMAERHTISLRIVIVQRSQEIRKQTGGGATEEIPTATGHEDFLQNISTSSSLVLELMTIQFEENSSYNHVFPI